MAKVYVADRYTDYFVSGTSSASSPDYRTHYYIYYDDNQDVANNRTRIQIDYYLKMVGTRTPTQMSSGVYINGNSSGNYITIPQKSYSSGMHYLGSKDWYIYHDGLGNGSYTFRGILYGGGKWTNRYTTGTTTYTLPTIPRYAYINNYSVWNNGLTQIGVWWTADKAIDAVQYSLSGGGWVGTSGNTFYINGLTPGTKYSVKIRVKATDSQLWTESGTLYATTTDKAKITNANNFNDSQSPYFTFTNPSGSTINAFIGYNDGTGIWKNNIPNTGNYTFNLTQAEWNVLYNKNHSLSKFTVLYRLRMSVSGTNYDSDIIKEMTIINANPTFSNFDYADTNTVTTALTGNNQKIIKGYSNLRARVTSANKMIANKGANPIEYQLVVGSKQIKEDYSSSANVDMILNAIDNNVFIVYAIDSRGNSTPIQKSPATYIDYFKPVITKLEYTRENDIGTKTTINLTGSFFNASFGSQTNTISATYKYKRTNSDTWITGVTPLVLTPSGNTFSCNQLIAGDLGANGFNAENSYDIEITVKDKLDTASSPVVVDSGKPNMAYAKEGIAINQLYDESQGSGFQISGNKLMFNGLTLFEWVE